jgi:hypothetical protein
VSRVIAGAVVAEDLADLGGVELEVDDQVAGEGVAEVVEAEGWLSVWVEACFGGGAGEAAAFDVAVAEWCAEAGGEDVVAGAGVGAREFVFFEEVGELGEEGDVTGGGGGVQADAFGSFVLARARELVAVADVDEPVVEVDVLPGEAEQFGEAHAGVEGRGDERPVGVQGVVEEFPDLVVAEHALFSFVGAGAFAFVQAPEGVVVD